jgi:hypothetical protein
MIVSKTYEFESEFPVPLSQIISATEFNNVYIQNLSQELDVYIGDETVSGSNYGIRLVPLSTVYMPFLDITQNQNMNIIGSPGAKFSVFGWYGIHPVFNAFN